MLLISLKVKANCIKYNTCSFLKSLCKKCNKVNMKMEHLNLANYCYSVVETDVLKIKVKELKFQKIECFVF